jgi:hypothetical protein
VTFSGLLINPYTMYSFFCSPQGTFATADPCCQHYPCVDYNGSHPQASVSFPIFTTVWTSAAWYVETIVTCFFFNSALISQQCSRCLQYIFLHLVSSLQTVFMCIFMWFSCEQSSFAKYVIYNQIDTFTNVGTHHMQVMWLPVWSKLMWTHTNCAEN